MTAGMTAGMTGPPLPEAGPAALRDAAALVLRDYEAFLAAGPGPGGHEDGKAFAAFHASARAALAHLEHLFKLGRSLASPDAGLAEAEEDARLLTRTRAAIAEGASHDEDEDDDGTDSA